MPSQGAGPYAIGSGHWPGMSKLIEEMGELNQVLGKIIALGGDIAGKHWDGTDLAERLDNELGDVGAALRFFIRVNELPMEKIAARTVKKESWFEAWQVDQEAPVG